MADGSEKAWRHQTLAHGCSGPILSAEQISGNDREISVLPGNGSEINLSIAV